MKSVRALILSMVAGELAVSSATFCLISGEAWRLLAVRPAYHSPMSFHEPLFLAALVPDGKYFTPIRPAIACQGGISRSGSMAGTFSISQVYEFSPVFFS